MSSGFDKSGGLVVSGAKTFFSAINYNVVSLTSSSSVTIDASLGNIFYLPLGVGGATTLNAPINPKNGQQITVMIKHFAANNTATWNAIWKFPGGTKGTFSTSLGTVDSFTATYSSSINGWLTTFSKGYA